uniref:Alpha-amylase inhibitor-like n=1 Tax=Phaseolus microcarpus TaxID=87068 RepID=Q5ZEX4_9FABA|nr:alpha-amylase inhibitor-like precursor [Phaseolus microcarpus]
MASSNFSTVLSLALFLVLLTHANSASETSFNFHTFNKTNLILQGDATVSSKGHLRLTDDTGDSMGRAFYSAPVQIRDSTTGKVASFDTNFTFNMPVHKENPYGLAFALVPVGSRPKSKGHFLGLFDKRNDKEASTVAVAFVNHWYPSSNGRLIGIDVNSILPIERAPWYFGQGRQADVRITYHSSSTVLEVSLYYPSTGKSYDFYSRVKLDEEVDDWVSVGFSATSGLSEVSNETNDLISWSFSSKFSDHTTSESSNLANVVLNKIL